MASTQAAIRGDGAGKEQHDARPKTLAPGGEQMLGRSLKDRVTRPNEGTKVGQQGIEVRLDRL